MLLAKHRLLRLTSADTFINTFKHHIDTYTSCSRGALREENNKTQKISTTPYMFQYVRSYVHVIHTLLFKISILC